MMQGLPRGKSQGELSEEGPLAGSFAVSTAADPFSSHGTTPNASFGGNNMSFGTLNMMEHLRQHNEREDTDWKDLESCIRNTTHSPPPQGGGGGGSRGVSPQGYSQGVRSPAMNGNGVSPNGGGLHGQQQQQPMPPPTLSAEVKYFEYPQLPPDTAGRTVAPPEDSGCVKLFMGNMRFEMKRGTIAWAIQKAIGAKEMDPSRVLIHYKSSNGNQTPTGCASVFMEPEEAKLLLEFNQRIFCGATGVYASMTSEAMRSLLRDKRVLDTGPDGRIRGPKHAVVIEMSRATPNASFSSNSHAGTLGAGSPGGYGGSRGAMAGNSPGNGNQHFAQPKTHPQQHQQSQSQSPPNHHHGQQQQPNHVAAALATANSTTGIPLPVYHSYPGVGTEMAEPQALVNPTEFFVGGICYEATPHFVAWMISLTSVKINSQNVTLFEDNKTGGKRGCAMVKVDGSVFPTIRAYHHRLLCDSRGVYVAESTQGIPAFIRQQKANGEVLRGPSHAVVIEKRRAQATPPPAYDGPPPPAYHMNQGPPSSQQAMPAPQSTSWSMMPPVTASAGLPAAQPAMLKPSSMPFTASQNTNPPFIAGPTTPPSMPLHSFSPRPDGPPSPSMMAMNPNGLPRGLGTPPSIGLADIPKPTWKKSASEASTPRGGVSVSSQSSACGGN